MKHHVGPTSFDSGFGVACKIKKNHAQTIQMLACRQVHLESRNPVGDGLYEQSPNWARSGYLKTAISYCMMPWLLGSKAMGKRQSKQ